jgi:hypothetical protein
MITGLAEWAAQSLVAGWTITIDVSMITLTTRDGERLAWPVRSWTGYDPDKMPESLKVELAKWVAEATPAIAQPREEVADGR